MEEEEKIRSIKCNQRVTRGGGGVGWRWHGRFVKKKKLYLKFKDKFFGMSS